MKKLSSVVLCAGFMAALANAQPSPPPDPTLGHGPEETRATAFGVTFARGAEWAATGKVTLPIPAEIALVSRDSNSAGER